MSKIIKIQDNIYVVDNRETIEYCTEITQTTDNSNNNEKWAEENKKKEKADIYKVTLKEDLEKFFKENENKSIYFGQLYLDGLPNLEKIDEKLKYKIIEEYVWYTLYKPGEENSLITWIGIYTYYM